MRSKAREALDHYNKALEYLKQDNWAGYGKELQQMKDDFIRNERRQRNRPENKTAIKEGLSVPTKEVMKYRPLLFLCLRA